MEVEAQVSSRNYFSKLDKQLVHQLYLFIKLILKCLDINLISFSNRTIVTTPTQPQLNSKVGFDTKMTLDHHQYHKLNVINISPVPDPISTKL